MAKDDTSRRRTAHTGALYQRKSDGMWCAAVTLPNGPDGKRRRKVIARASRADAQRELKALVQKAARVGDLPTSSPTLATWVDTWWERYGDRLKLSTQPSYRSSLKNYILPTLGRYRLDKLGAEHVHRLRRYVVEEKDLSPTTALQAHRVLSVVLRDAEREGKITRNPCSLVDAPSKGIYEVEYLSNDEARTLLKSLDHGDGEVSMDLARRAMALLLGRRQGERLGTTRDAIDLDAGTIRLDWQLQRLPFEHGCGEQDGERWPCDRKRGGNCPHRKITIPKTQEIRHVDGGLYLTRPKTKASRRATPMPDLLTAILRRYLETHEPGMEGLIFTRDGGRPIDPSDDRDDWVAALEAVGLPIVKGHSARHTCNTVLTELGVPVDVRQAILGHASRAVNEAIYTHTSDKRVIEAMDKLGTALDWR